MRVEEVADYTGIGRNTVRNLIVGEMLDMWIEEDLKPSSLSNGTVMAYTAAVGRIKKHPLGKRKLKTVKSDHLQAFIDFMSYGGTARCVSICGVSQAVHYL